MARRLRHGLESRAHYTFEASVSSKSKRNTPTKEMLREVARTAPPAISAAEAADALQRHMGATGAVVASAARVRRIGRPA